MSGRGSPGAFPGASVRSVEEGAACPNVRWAVYPVWLLLGRTRYRLPFFFYFFDLMFRYVYVWVFSCFVLFFQSLKVTFLTIVYLIAFGGLYLEILGEMGYLTSNGIMIICTGNGRIKSRFLDIILWNGGFLDHKTSQIYFWPVKLWLPLKFPPKNLTPSIFCPKIWNPLKHSGRVFPH